MIEAYLRPIYQYYIVNPVANFFKKLSPEWITYSACIIGTLVAPLLVLGLLKTATIFLLISGFLDTLDGTVARLYKKATEMGSILDIISDRAVELAVILGLFAMDPVHRGWQALAMLGSLYLCMTCFLVVAVLNQGPSQKGIYYSPGLVERAEAFLFFILMIWLPSYFNFLAMAFTTLVFFTSYLHIKQFINAKTETKPLIPAMHKKG